MADRDYTEQLHSVVKAILQDYSLEIFEDYWELGREILEGNPVRRFYTHAEPSYGNVAILTDEFIVDIDGDERYNSGGIHLRKLRSIDGIHFHEGPMDTIPEAREAELILIIDIAGLEEVGPYWFANTEQEREYLIAFGKSIIEVIA